MWRICKIIGGSVYNDRWKNQKFQWTGICCILYWKCCSKAGVDAERVYQAFTEKSDILNGYIVLEYEVLHTQSREYIVDDLLDVMKEKEVEVWTQIQFCFRKSIVVSLNVLQWAVACWCNSPFDDTNICLIVNA